MVAPTLSALLQHVSVDFNSRIAVYVPGKIDATYARLKDLVDRTASMLLFLQIHHGDVVALSFANTIEFVVLFLAILQIRATAAPLNPVYTSDEFEFYLTDSESKVVITPEEHNSVKEAATKLGIRHITVRFCTKEGNIVFSGFTEEPVLKSDVDFVNDPSDVALFLHTSGTTSRPKGVPLTQLNLASSVQNIKSVYRLTQSDSTVIVLPLFHVHGLLCGLLASLASGGSVILPSSGRFSASTFWSDMRRYRATWYTSVPTIHQIILERHLVKPEIEYPKLRFIRSCSASLAPSIMKRLEEAFGAPVVEAYAMTEATHLMTSNPLPVDGIRKPRSVGKAVGQEMCICDTNGVIQKMGMEGEVCVRGANVTKGYKNNPQANKSAFHNLGWFRTGDLGFIDADSYLHLVGRIKELINRGGEKISPLEVDAVLLSHPDIDQAVAFGVPDDKYGEEINCALIIKEGSGIKETDVMEFCKKNLAVFKVPKKIFFADSFPKTASGKIQRLAVAHHFISQVSAVNV